MESYLKPIKIPTPVQKGFWAKHSYLLLEWEQEENEELGYQGFRKLYRRTNSQLSGDLFLQLIWDQS